MRTPNADQAEVPERKVTHYLLALGSEEGHSKAVFFISKGFTPKHWRLLAEGLVAHVRSNEVADRKQTQWGTKYVVDGPLQCPDGSVANIRSVWNIKPPETHPGLVTAHPLPRVPEKGA